MASVKTAPADIPPSNSLRGPWGEIEAAPLILEPPDQLIAINRHLFTHKQDIIWEFPKQSKPWQLGDLILIVDSENAEWIHGCNYVAGNVVFTKNGTSVMRPWVFQDLNFVLAKYLRAERISAVFFRLKPPFQKG